MAKPDKPEKEEKDSPLDHDQGKGNDPDTVDNELPEPDEEDGEPETQPA